MKTIIAAGIASALAIGSLGYAAGARSVSGAIPASGAFTTLAEPAAPAAAGNAFAARPAARTIPITTYEPAAPVVAPAAVERVAEPARPKRSWKKTAIVIGAGAGSGAVVGGIIDGKKGAGIGAAIGGGAASVYEVLKRR